MGFFVGHEEMSIRRRGFAWVMKDSVARRAAGSHSTGLLPALASRGPAAMQCLELALVIQYLSGS